MKHFFCFPMEATIVSFRRARHHTYPNQMIIKVPKVDTKEKSQKLVGKSVVWISEGKLKKEIKGEIRSSHGNKGALRVLFESGMPGQAIGTKVKLN